MNEKENSSQTRKEISMKMNTPKMTVTREQALVLYTEDFEKAAKELYTHHDLEDFDADDICEAVLEQVTATDIDAQDWVESLTDESKREIVTTMQAYFEEYILNVTHNNFDYIMEKNGWAK